MLNSISIPTRLRFYETIKMTMPTHFQFQLRHQHLTQDGGGHSAWQEVITPKTVSADQTTIIVCDMWDNHWSRGAAERVNALAPRMNRVLNRARDASAWIIHAPSETMKFYDDTAARKRALAIPLVEPPPACEHIDPPLPIDDSDGGSDTGETQMVRAWSRQHPALSIDQERDYITDNGQQVYSILHHHAIEQVLIMGVHTNMCVLRRSFAIKQMVKWGVNIALVRDLTDAMYNPALRPYVSHEEGTRLVVEYIEKFWCPSVMSEDLMMSDA